MVVRIRLDSMQLRSEHVLFPIQLETPKQTLVYATQKKPQSAKNNLLFFKNRSSFRIAIALTTRRPASSRE